MDYTQLIQPNTNIAWVNGVCLVDVREVFGVSSKYPTAIANWDANSAVNHPGATPPSDIAVPIFFTYSGPDGHVCLWDHGTIYTSSAQGKQVFTSIQALINWMGEDFKYLGWSEEIESTPVVKSIPAPAAPSGSKLPATGSEIQLIPTQTRTTWKVGTAIQAGTIKVTDNTFVYTVRGYDSKYPGRIIINSASGGGNGVGLALYYLSGAIVPGWKEV